MISLWKHTGWTVFLVTAFLSCSTSVTTIFLGRFEWLSEEQNGSTTEGLFRMIQGDEPNSGSIEINTPDGFSPLCDSYITEDIALRICEHLGLPRLNVSLNNQNIATISTNLTCEGNIRNVSDCLLSAGNISDCGETRGISCGGTLRMPHIKSWDIDYGSGEVEVYHGGKWNRVCAGEADFRVARVMCVGIGDFSGLNAHGYLYDPEPGPFVSMSCLGNETIHEECTIRPVSTCTKGFGLQCNGSDIFPNVTSTDVVGQFNVSIKTFVACDIENQHVEGEQQEEIGNALASVICSQEGFLRYPAHFVPSIPVEHSVALQTFMCTGEENWLSECTTRRHTYALSECFIQIGKVVVECSEPMRLAGGNTDYQGWLEKRDFSTYDWEPMLGSITTTHMAAQTICRQLDLTGYASNLIFETTISGGDAYTMVCNGKERALDECETRILSDPSNAVAKLGVNCKGTPNGGLGDWSPQSSSFLIKSFSGLHESNQLVNVLCHQLGYQRSRVDVTSIANVNEGEGHVFTGVSDRWCVGIEESVQHCHTIIDKAQLFTSSQNILNVTCHDAGECQTGYAIPVQHPIKTCYEGGCLGDNCENITTITCEQACQIDHFYPLSAIGGEYTVTVTCSQGQCIPTRQVDSTGVFSRQCCYTDLCNHRSLGPLTSEIAQLVLGGVQYEGIFMTKLGGKTVSLRDDTSITDHALRALCRKAGFVTTSAVRALYDGGRTEVTLPCIANIDFNKCKNFVASDPRCKGTSVMCSNNHLTLKCNAVSPPFRLVDGPSDNVGRLEVNLRNSWGTVSGEGYTLGASDVICRSLGFPGGCSSHWLVSPFKETELPVHISELNCHGNETNIWKCNYVLNDPNFPSNNSYIVALMCQSGTAPEPVFTTKTTTTTEYPTSVQAASSAGISCYQGDCLTSECADEATRSDIATRTTCTLGQGTKCFITGNTQRLGGAASTVTFGCKLDCAPGLVRLTNTEVNYCCSSDLCNLEPDTLRELVGAIAESGSTPCRFTTLSAITSIIVLLAALFDY